MRRPPLPIWLKWLTLSLLIAWSAYHLLTLTIYPPVWCDEAVYTNAAVAFLNDGRFTLPMHGGVVGLDDNFSTAGRLYTAGLALTLATLKTGLWQARLFSLLAWAASVALVYLVGREWYGASVGALAALVYGLGFETFIRAHLVRPDTWAAAAVLLEVYLYQRARRRPTPLHLALTGLVGMLAVDMYWNAIHFGLIIALLVMVDFGWRQRRLDLVAAYALGGLLGAAYFVAVHAYPDPQAAHRQWFGVLPDGGYSPAGRLGVMSYWLLSFFWNSDRGLAAMQTVLALLGTGLAAWRHRPADRELVVITVLSWTAFAFLFSDQNWTQVGAWLPFLALLIARGADVVAGVITDRLNHLLHLPRLSRSLLRLSHAAWSILLLAPWLVINIIAGLYLGYRFRQHDPLAYLGSLAAYVQPPDSGVLARGLWWFGVPNSRFIHSLALDHHRAFEQPDGILTRAEAAHWLADHNITYLVWETGFECNYSSLEPPSVTMPELAEHHCEPIGSLQSLFYGLAAPGTYGHSLPTIVYRCNFSEDDNKVTLP